MSVVNQEVKDGNFNLNVDSNEDGNNSLSFKLKLSEAIAEIIAKEESIEGAKVVDFKFELTRLYLRIDTDKDGEEVLELEVDLAETFKEIQALIKK